MITIYHNTRCSKSRECLEVLKNTGENYEVREYLKQPINEEELENLLQKLNMKPMEVVRKNEKIWKENYKDKTLSDKELIHILVENPKLIERPIVVKEDKAVIGRPASAINNL